MKLDLNDIVINKNDNWENILTYEIIDKIGDEFIISINKKGHREKEKMLIKNPDDLRIYPFFFFMRRKYGDLASMIEKVADLVCALLHKNRSMELDKIIKFLMEHKEKYAIKNHEDGNWILRCLTAARVIVAKIDGNSIFFSLPDARVARENVRKFSANIVGELSVLSERIRNIIDHGPTVGTYRENILQNALQKHLPERYHVATGFIFGLNRQIDILVYDRIDYAPLFKEGDLVVVPAESVRAVIEVKTTLNSKNLISALDLIQSAAGLDDNRPPFFRGIFAFESSMSENNIHKKISNYYYDTNTIAQGGPGDLICRPFQHLTCACVVNKSLTYIDYSRNKNNKLVPVLYAKESATGLYSQASLFMQILLSYLKFGGIKPLKINYMKRLLGEDTSSKKIKELIDASESWGAYYLYDEGDVEMEAVVAMESLILSVKSWIDGEENSDEFPYC